MGHVTTVVGILLSAACAYAATHFNNIMDFLQLVFAFVNAPLFATFMLGMFWRRATGHGAFFGLLAGTTAAAVHHGLTIPHAALVKAAESLKLTVPDGMLSRTSEVVAKAAGIHGGWLGSIVHTYPSDMAQNFWTAIFAWTVCFVATILISLATKTNKTNDQLKGLVYSLTPKIKDRDVPWYKQPATLGLIVIAGAVVLNIIFW
jgi:SSS family solute:Na+ symporter